MTADQWNALYPEGTPVTAYPGFLPADAGGLDITVLETTTRSRAWTLGGHTPVVMVDSHGGGIALTHVFPRTTADVR